MKKAYVTTLTHGDAYAPGVEALGRSLRATTAEPMVLMVTEDVPRHARNRLASQGWTLHEIQPVKFGGSPTDMANKMLLPTAEHIGPDGVHPQFWQPLLQWVTGGGG